MKQRISTYLVAALLAVGASAFAHGNEEHPASGPAKKEQVAWGIAGDAKSVKRTIEIAMTDDMKFTPAKLDVKQGETVRLKVTNKGQVLHEYVLGTQKTLDEHAAMMLKFPNMEHAEPYMTHVKPGQTGEIVWTFNRAGEFDFACLIAGHYQAGMKGKVLVSAK